MAKVALTGTTGKLGSAILTSILQNDLIPASSLIICTSTEPSSTTKFDSLESLGATIRYSNYDDITSMERAFTGCDKLLLVSTPRIDLDFGNAENGKGREGQHISAIKAALKVGVGHIYYTSLGFGDGKEGNGSDESKAAVMWAHLRTEAYLRENVAREQWTVLREGLYNESWPLYLGYFDPKGDDRGEVLLGGDGKISWTAISDLGLASALILVGKEGKYAGQVITLSATEAHTMKEVAAMVSKYAGKEVTVKIVSGAEHERHYVEERGKDAAAVEWWASTYEALPLGEALKDDSTLTDLLASQGRTPKPMEETVKEMLAG